MKEFTYRIDKAFKNGLKPDSERRMVGAKEFLDVASDTLCTKQGLINFSDDKRPRDILLEASLLAAGISNTYPYPTFIQTSYHGYGNASVIEKDIYAMGSTTMGAVNVGTDPPDDTTITPNETYAWDSPLSAEVWTNSELPWSSADFGNGNIFLFNGISVVFRTTLGMTNSDYANSLGKFLVYNYDGQTKTAAPIKCGCALNGRLIMGGFSNQFVGTDYQNYLRYLQEATLQEGQYDVEFDEAVNVNEFKNYIWWSSIGGGDMLYPFFPELMESGTVSNTMNPYDDDRPRWDDLIERNQGGFMPMPFPRSEIMDILPMGKGVVVYTNCGIAYCPEVNKGNISTFGCKVISETQGIRDKGAVAGDDKIHLFINTHGEVCRIVTGTSKSGSPTGPKLEVLFGRHSTVPNFHSTVVFDEAQRLFYINTVLINNCSIVNEYGITSTTRNVHSLMQMGDRDVYEQYKHNTFWYTKSHPITENFLNIRTDEIDFGIAGIKLIKSIDVGFDIEGLSLADWTTRVHVYNNASDGWVMKQKSGISELRNVFVNESGLKFKIEFVYMGTHDITHNESTLSFDYIDIKWALIDKRFVRGVYAQSNPGEKK